MAQSPFDKNNNTAYNPFNDDAQNDTVVGVDPNTGVLMDNQYYYNPITGKSDAIPTTTQAEETKDNGYLGWFKDSIDAGIANVYGGQAHFADTFTPFGKETAQDLDALAEKNSRSKNFSKDAILNDPLKYISDPQGLTYDVGNMAGSATGMGLEAAGVATVGAAVGLGTLGSAATTLAGKAAAQGMTGLAKALSSKWGPIIVANIAKTPLEVMSESGNVSSDMEKDGKSLSERQKAALMNTVIQTPLLAISNTVESMGLGTMLGSKVSSVAGNALLGAVGMAGGAGQQAWEEGMQRGSSDYSKGEQPGGLTSIVNPFEWSEGQWDEAAAAFGPGLLMGAGGVGASKLAKVADNIAERRKVPTFEGEVVEDTPFGQNNQPRIGNNDEGWNTIDVDAEGVDSDTSNKEGGPNEIAAVGTYKQDDDRWSSNGYAANDIGTSGCGVTAIANLAKAYGLDITPDQVAEFSIENGASTESGTAFSLYDTFAKKMLGMDMEQTENFDEVKKALANGIPVIVGYDNGKWTSANGHVMVLKGVDSNGNIIVQDSRTNKDMSGAYTDEDINRDGALFWIPNKTPSNTTTASNASVNNSSTTSMEDMLKYLGENQYQFDADTNNAIDDALTTENPDKVEEIFKVVKDKNNVMDIFNKMPKNEQANTEVTPSDNVDSKEETPVKLPDVKKTLQGKSSVGMNIASKGVSALTRAAISNPKMINLAQRALQGDIQAVNAINKINKTVKERLLQIAQSSKNAPSNVPNVPQMENTNNRISERPAGNTVQVITDNGKEFNAQYKVVDADDLVTSHLPENSANMAKNPDYPAELQPRNRESVAMQQQVIGMANALRPADLGASRNLNNGAPLVNANGVVENGNGRSIAIIRALKSKNKSGKDYRKWLNDHAAEFGLTPEQITAIKNPILIRQRTDDTIDTNAIINSTAGGARLSASEQGKSDAQKLTEGTLSLYAENDMGDLLSADNKDFVTAALRDITGNNPGELNVLLTEDGLVSQQGIARIKNALFAKAYGDDGLLALMSESTDNNIRNITNALINIAPSFAILNDKIAKGLRFNVDVTEPVAEACHKLMVLRREEIPVATFLLETETAMFTDETGKEISDSAKDVLQFIEENKRSSKAIRNFLMFMADTINAAGDPRQISLLDNEKAPTATGIINLAVANSTGELKPLTSNDTINDVQQGGNSNVKTEVLEEKIAGEGQDRNENAQSGQVGTPKDTESDRFEKGGSSGDTILKEGKSSKGKVTAEETSTDEKSNRFNGERGKAKMDKLFKKREKPTETASSDDTIKTNKKFNIFDESKEEELKRKIAEKLKDRLSANPFFDPDLMVDLLQYGGIKLQQGLNSFSKWSASMAETFSDKVKPYLKSVWSALQSYPSDIAFDEERMSAVMEYVGSLIDEGKTAAEIKEALESDYDDTGLSVYVDSAFNAVTNYPREIAEDREGTGEPKVLENDALVAGTFVHTKTGENMPNVKIIQNLNTVYGKDKANALKRLAKKHNGWYSSWKRNYQYLFHNEEDRNAFFNEASSTLGIENSGDKVVESKENTTKGADNYVGNGTRVQGVASGIQAGSLQGIEGNESSGPVLSKEDKRSEDVLSGNVTEPKAEQSQQIRATNGEDISRQTSGTDSKGTDEQISVRNGLEEDKTVEPETKAEAIVKTERKAEETKPKLTPAQKLNAKASEKPGHNYRITNMQLAEDGGPKAKFKSNIDAITLLKQLEAEGRMATPKEQEVLAQYVGWGGLSNAFDEYNRTWQGEAKQLKELLTTDEYRAARATVTSSFYTPPMVISSMWDIVKRLGFKGGRVLEPGMGIGNIFGVMPKNLMANSSLTGVEIDSLTGRIAKQLYQKANIQIKGFEKLQSGDNFYDLVIGNVPFTTQVIDDARYNKYKLGLNNYFFAKAIDSVREGGIVAFITSMNTMTTGHGAEVLRSILNTKADFLGAVGLPNTTFKKNAGTEVTSVLIVLQKRKEGEGPSKNNKEWLNVIPTEFDYKGYTTITKDLNEYFVSNPDMMLGKATVGDYRSDFMINGEGLDLENALADVVSKFPKNIVKGRERSTVSSVSSTKKALSVDEGKIDSFITKDGKVYQITTSGNENNAVEVPSAIQKKASDYVKLRDVYKKLLATQIDPKADEATNAKLRAELNKAYDNFVKKNGYLSESKNTTKLNVDPEYGMVQALEVIGKDKDTGKEVFNKANIFTKRTVQPIQETTVASTPADALIVSLVQKGKVDTEFIESLLPDMKKEDIMDSLAGRMYQNPATEEYEITEQYLSGDVKEKLEVAQEAAKIEPSYEKNVQALLQIQPPDVQYTDISAPLGASWIPSSDIEDFTKHILDSYRIPIKATHVDVTGHWIIEWNDFSRDAQRGYENNQKWGINRSLYDFKGLLEKILNNSVISVTDPDPDDRTKRIYNKEQTEAARAKATEIKEEFKKWLWEDDDRRNRLAAYYNRNFNNIVLRSYDGNFVNISEHGANNAIKLREHQKNAIWRILSDGTALLAHGVGTGKTWTMQAAGMELRRLGLANKIMYAVPNNIVSQFKNEFIDLYPSAKLLVIDSKTLPDAEVKAKDKDKDKKGTQKKTEEAQRISNAKRQKALARIATEDWDGIIISHDMLKRIPISFEYYKEFIDQQLDDYEVALHQLMLQAREEGNKSSHKRTIKDLEKSISRLKEKLEKASNMKAKDIVIPFEQLGIDQLFVDEADMFKNLAFPTGLTRIKGISTTAAQRSEDMFMKTTYLEKAHNGRGVVFATGTPVSNTINEMFTMMRYLEPQALSKSGFTFFDSWAGTYGVIQDTTELSPTGDGVKNVTTMQSFNNMPELIKQFRSVADVIHASDTNINLPKIQTGKPIVIQVPSNPALDQFIKVDAFNRAKAIKNGGGGRKGEDNMLVLTNDLRKAALDIRLVDPSIPQGVAGGKIAALVDNVWKGYQDSQDTKGTQLVFCDLSTPKDKGENKKSNKSSEDSENLNDDDTETAEEAEARLNVYNNIKESLIAKGIPANEIAFIHDAKTPVKKEALIDAFNAGTIRVLIGSTAKMGAGMNIQKRIVAHHDLDCPWRPRDIEQRRGRSIRQGNMNEEVAIYTYITKGSFDANMWEKIKNKQAMIDQAMSGNLEIRTIEDVSPSALDFAEIAALATGNPALQKKMLTDAKVLKMAALKSSDDSSRAESRQKIAETPDRVARLKKDIALVQKDIATRKDVKGDNFSMTIKGTVYNDKAKADEAFKAMLKTYTKTGESVGNIGGFSIEVSPYSSGDFLLKGPVSKAGYYLNTQSVQGAINTLYAEPEKRIESWEKNIVEAEKFVSTATKELQKPWIYEDEYRDLLKQQAELAKEVEKLNENYNAEEEAKKEQEQADTQYQAAYHGSPHTFDNFDITKIGSGQGAQSHGWGLYFAQDREISEGYKEDLVNDWYEYITVGDKKYITDNGGESWTINGNEVSENEFAVLDAVMTAEYEGGGFARVLKELSGNEEAIALAEKWKAQNKLSLERSEGALYEVDIPEVNVLLDEQEMFIDQPKAVQKGILAAIEDAEIQTGQAFVDYAGKRGTTETAIATMDGKEIYTTLSDMLNGDKEASMALNENGVKGITYEGNQDGRCFVIFDDQSVEIMQKYDAALRKHAKEIRRSINDLKAEVKDAFKGAEVTEEGNNTLKVVTKNGNTVLVELKDKIIVGDKETKSARKAHNLNDSNKGVVIGGYYRKAINKKSFLALSQEGSKGTGYHEAFHAAWDWALSDKEKEAMLKYYQKRADQRNKDVNEHMADAYRAWKRMREMKKGTIFGKLYQKISDFVHSIGAVFTGIDNVHNIFRKIENGEVFGRKENQSLYDVSDRINKIKQRFDKFISTSLKYPNRSLEFDLGAVTKEEAKAVLSATGYDVSGFKHIVNSSDVVHQQKRHGVATEKVEGQVGIPPKDIPNAVSVILAPDSIKKGTPSRNGAPSIRYLKNNGNGQYTVVEAIRTSNKKLALKTMWKETSARLHADKNGPQHTSITGSEQFPSITANISPEGDNVNDIQYSIRKAAENLAENLAGLKKQNEKSDKINVEKVKQTDAQRFGMMSDKLYSPSYIAEKFPKFKLFFKMADTAMHQQEKTRNHFNKGMKRVFDKLKDPTDKKLWQDALWQGDVEGKEFSPAELKTMGLSDNAISAYGSVRTMVRQAYTMVNDARQRMRTFQKNMSEKGLNALKENKFAKIVRSEKLDDDSYLVTYKMPKVWNRHVVVDQKTYKELNADENIRITTDNVLPDGSHDIHYQEKSGDINNRKGYIPHFFHDYFVMRKTEKNGNVIIGSARTVKEAIKIAERFVEENPTVDDKVVIKPKSFSMDDNEALRAATVGDMEYAKVVEKVMDDLEMTMAEAKDFLKGKVKLHGRNRFFGNMMQRKGAKGFEKDLDWVLKHYFNSAARYAALEEFKPNAYSLFERYFGPFDKDYSDNPLAHYTKQYINDVNGNPSNLETMINNFLNGIDWWRNHVASSFGDRAALQLASNITGKISVLKLGFLNVSSALLNLSQILNAAGITNDFTETAKAMQDVLHPTMSVKKIFAATGLQEDITLDSGSAYTKISPSKLAGKSMYLFSKMDMYSRKVAALAGYRTGRKRGMNHKEAIQYAIDVNRKANFDYGVADAPNVFRRGSILSQIALQFKKYPIKELELMRELVTKGTVGQNAKFWGTYFLICGLLQVPAMDWFDSIWEELFGVSPKNKIKKMIFEAAGDNQLGRQIAKVAIYGLGAVDPINIDASSRVGVGDVNPSAKNGLDSMLGGASYDTAKQFAKAVGHGDSLQAIKALSPTLGNYAQAVMGHTEGSRGRKLNNIEGIYERLLKATGFRNADESIQRDVKNIVSDENKELRNKQKALIDNALGKQAEGHELSKDEIKDLKDAGVTGKMLQNERVKKAQTDKERMLSNMGKKQKQHNQDVLKFMK